MSDEPLDVDDRDQVVMVLTTCPDDASAEQLARRLVDLRLAACVQAETIRSWYHWEDAVQDDPEVRLACKTTMACYADIAQLIDAEHPYEEPQLVVIPVLTGADGYLDWVRQQVG